MKPSMREIARATAAYFNIPVSELYSQNRARRVAWPRQIAMSLCREMLGKSLFDIGHRFGGRDHTTSLHGANEAMERARNDDDALKDMMTIAAMASGMSIDRNRLEQEWALSLHAGQPYVEMPPAPPPEPPQAPVPEVLRLPVVHASPARHILVAAGRYNLPRPSLMTTYLRQPTKARLMGGRA